MIPAKFDYIKASSVSEVIGLLDKHGDEAKILSGGHSLIPAMKLRLSRPEMLIDISGISGMNTISEEGDEIVIGANCTHAAIVKSDLINSKLHILAQTQTGFGAPLQTPRSCRQACQTAPPAFDARHQCGYVPSQLC